MNGISSVNVDFMPERLRARNEISHVFSYQERSIDRLQATEKLQPLIDKLDQSTVATDFVADIEASFTQESVKVLPQEGKRTIRLAAEAVGNEKVLGWIAAAKDDMEEYTWMVRVETPRPPEDMIHEIQQDLTILVDIAPLHIQELLRPRVQVVNTIFEWFQQCIRQNTVVSETDTTINQQLEEGLSSLRKFLEQQEQAGTKAREAIEDEESEDEESAGEKSAGGKSADEDWVPSKRRSRRNPARRPLK